MFFFKIDNKVKFDYLKKVEEKEDKPIKEALPGFFKRENFQNFS